MGARTERTGADGAPKSCRAGLHDGRAAHFERPSRVPTGLNSREGEAFRHELPKSFLFNAAQSARTRLLG
jgi:hypothetical protein